VTAAGGKGANQAVAAARAGGHVSFIARVGQDVFGDQAVAGSSRTVSTWNTSCATQTVPSASPSSSWPRTARTASRRIRGQRPPGTYRRGKGANADRLAAVVVTQLETPLATVQAAAEIAAKAGVSVILNPARRTALSDDLLRLVSILTPNETEAELLTGIKVDDTASASQAADLLLAEACKP